MKTPSHFPRFEKIISIERKPLKDDEGFWNTVKLKPHKDESSTSNLTEITVEFDTIMVPTDICLNSMNNLIVIIKPEDDFDTDFSLSDNPEDPDPASIWNGEEMVADWQLLQRKI